MEQSLSANSLAGNPANGSGSSRSQLHSQPQGASGTNSANGATTTNRGSNENNPDLDTSQEEIRGLSCQICYQNFSREGEHVPRNLQCGHSYCTSCLNRLVGQYCIGTVRCPTCKYETLINGFMDDVQQLPKNFGVLEILSAQEENSHKQGRSNPTMPRRPPPRPPHPSNSGQSGSSRGPGSSSTMVSNGGAVGIASSARSNYDISSMEILCPEHEGIFNTFSETSN